MMKECPVVKLIEINRQKILVRVRLAESVYLIEMADTVEVWFLESEWNVSPIVWTKPNKISCKGSPVVFALAILVPSPEYKLQSMIVQVWTSIVPSNGKSEDHWYQKPLVEGLPSIEKIFSSARSVKAMPA